MVHLWFSPIQTLGNGWWSSHNKWSEPLRALGVLEAWKIGLWDARWFPTFDHGYGYPFLSFYAPLFHWLSGVWLLLLGSSGRAVRANFASWLLVGTAGMYLAGEAFWSFATAGRSRLLRPGLVCAIGWLMSPYLLCDVYVRADGAEFAALQILPWIVWAGVRLLGPGHPWTRRDWSTWLCFEALAATGILTHNFFALVIVALAVVMVPLVMALRLCAGPRPEGRLAGLGVRSAAWLGGVAWALLLTAFFWLPALLEMKFTRVGVLREGDFNYSVHFLTWENLTRIRFWGFGLSKPGPDDGMPLHLGWASLAALVSVGAAWVVMAIPARRDRRVLAATTAAAVATLAAVAMTMEVSAGVWSRVTILQFAQFPWRLLGVATVGVCLLLPSAAIALRARSPWWTVVAAGALYAVSLEDYAKIARTLPITPEAIYAHWRELPILTADLDEYGPIWRPTDRPPSWASGTILGGEGLSATDVRSNGIDLTAALDNRTGMDQPVVVAFNYFPGWRAMLRGREAELPLSPDPGSGFIRVDAVPPGTSEVELRFGDTPTRRYCKLLSAGAGLGWLAAWPALGWATWGRRRGSR